MKLVKVESSDRRKHWLDYIDSTAKLAAAVAVIFAAFIASRYESRMTSVSLMNQREQSESALRASMFQNLIDPIVGQPLEGQQIDIDRERLLVELLTLNFHDHFEFKPLLVDVDRRLRRAGNTELHNDRDALASTARRVIARQFYKLNTAQRTYDGQDLSYITFTCRENRCSIPGTSTPSSSTPGTVSGQAVPASLSKVTWQGLSPDKTWDMAVSIFDIDFKKRTVNISLNATPLTPSAKASKRVSSEPKVQGFDFELTQFDFPLTDYTQLDSNNRIAFSLLAIDEPTQSALIRLIWFPPAYISERERPLDYRSMRKALKLD